MCVRCPRTGALRLTSCAGVGERIWLFRCIFSWSVCRQKNSVRDDLLLEGLDTFGSCFLNGTLVLRGANMFHEHRCALRAA